MALGDLAVLQRCVWLEQEGYQIGRLHFQPPSSRHPRRRVPLPAQALLPGPSCSARCRRRLCGRLVELQLVEALLDGVDRRRMSCKRFSTAPNLFSGSLRLWGRTRSTPRCACHVPRSCHWCRIAPLSGVLLVRHQLGLLVEQAPWCDPTHIFFVALAVLEHPLWAARRIPLWAARSSPPSGITTGTGHCARTAARRRLMEKKR